MSSKAFDRRLDQVVRKLASGGRLVQVWRLTGGISAEMTALEIDDADGKRLKAILRRPSAETLALNPEAAETEFRLLQLLRTAGLSAPEPYALDLSGEIYPAAYLVIEFVEGEIDFKPGDPADYARQMAEHLALIHRMDGAQAALSFLPRLPDDFAAYCPTLRKDVPIPFDEAPVRRVLHAAWPFQQRNPSTLLHGDYWPGNVLWRDGRLRAVIDWEDALIGDPLMDLAGCRMELFWIFGHEMMEAFTRRYLELSPIDTANLPYWELCAALRMAAWAFPDLAETAAFFRPYRRGDFTEQAIRKRCRDFVHRALPGLEKTP